MYLPKIGRQKLNNILQPTLVILEKAKEAENLIKNISQQLQQMAAKNIDEEDNLKGSDLLQLSMDLNGIRNFLKEINNKSTQVSDKINNLKIKYAVSEDL